MISKLVKVFVCFIAVISLMLLFGCDGKTLKVTTKSLDLWVGQNIDVDFEPKSIAEEIEWETADPGVATVTAGKIMAVGEGETVITAKLGGKEQQVNVKVSFITITFNVNGGSAVDDQKLSFNEKLEKPQNPHKDGAGFVDWYVDADFTNVYDFNTPVTDKLTLYAKWGALDYNIKFLIDEDVYLETRVETGGTVMEPSEPEKVGYDFAGWFFLYLNEYEIQYDFNTLVEEDLELYGKFTARDNIPYVVKHLAYNSVSGEFELKETENLKGKADQETLLNVKEYSGLISEYEEYRVVINADGSLVVEIKYVEMDFSVTYVLNGGNFTYKDKAEMVEDFLRDYNTYGGTSYTKENLPLGAWVNVNFHSFLYDERFYEKWKWMPAYLGVVGSSSNKKACAAFATVTNPTAFNGLNSNYIYALSYEIRGFILGIKYTENATWMSSDYSDYGLSNGFWDTFVQYRETTKFTDQKEVLVLNRNVYREGYEFVGWYTNEDLTGKQVNNVFRDCKVYAKWSEKNPVTGIRISNPISSIYKYESYQLSILVLPEAAFNKNVLYISSDDKIVKVSDTGLITAENAGTAVITVKSVNRDVKATITVTVLVSGDINICFSENYDGVLHIGEEADVTVTGVGDITGGAFSFKSNNTDVVTVDSNGHLIGLGVGEAMVEVLLSSTNTSLLSFIVPVCEEPETTRVDQLLDLLIKANHPVVETLNISLLSDRGGALQYFLPTYGSVNLYLFDELVIDETSYLIDPATMPTKHSGIMSSVEFITVHDTANINGGLYSHGDFWKNLAQSNSIHFTVGDHGVIQDLDTRYAAHHAGDGTSDVFKWDDTGVKANGNTHPVIDINGEGYFTFDGIKTSIVAPTKSGQILDKSYFTKLGPNWKIGDNGNYYLGTTWFTSGEVTRGIIGSKGGNMNSVGIEMCVNTSGDMYDTWQRTAKLVAKLIEDNNLGYERVVQHNTYTGKNCPQSLLYSDYWNNFMEFVKIEHIIRTQYADAVITMASSNKNLLSDTGRIVGMPKTTQSVNYTITVKIGEITRSIVLSSIIPGLPTWSQYNGLYEIK